MFWNKKKNMSKQQDKDDFKFKHSDLAYTITANQATKRSSSSANKYKSTAVSFHNSFRKCQSRSFLSNFLQQNQVKNQSTEEYRRYLEKMMSMQNLQNSQDPQNEKNKPKTYKEVVGGMIRLTKNCLRTQKNKDQIFSEKNRQIKNIGQNKQTGYQYYRLVQTCQDKIIEQIRSSKFIKRNKKEINEFMNMVYYSSDSMHSKTFTQIQNHILQQWRENSILVHFRDTFYLIVEQGFKANKQFTKIEGKLTLQNFKDLYHLFIELMGQALYYFFYGYFKYLVSIKRQKSKQWVIDRLVNFTSRYIFFQSSSWQFVCQHFILSQISIQNDLSEYKTLSKEKLPKYSKTSLNTLILNDEMPFPQTAMIIKKFTEKNKLIDKLKGLKQMRSKLEQEIINYQKILIQKQQLKDFILFQRDDFITSYLHCIVKNGVNLQELQKSLKVLELILEDPFGFMGNTMMTMLSLHQCSSYFTDLEAIIDFIGYQLSSLKNKHQQ